MLSTGLLSGHFLVDIHNEAFATAHAGVVNKDFDIFRAFVCYKGQIRYNFNVLKVRIVKDISCSVLEVVLLENTIGILMQICNFLCVFRFNIFVASPRGKT